MMWKLYPELIESYTSCELVHEDPWRSEESQSGGSTTFIPQLMN